MHTMCAKLNAHSLLRNFITKFLQCNTVIHVLQNFIANCYALLAWVYPCCLARSKFRSARQSGGYDRFLSQEFAKIWYPITERGGTERRWRVLCDRRKLVVRSYGSNMAAAEAKLSFDVAVDSVLDSLKANVWLCTPSSPPKRTF